MASMQDKILKLQELVIDDLIELYESGKMKAADKKIAADMLKLHGVTAEPVKGDPSKLLNPILEMDTNIPMRRVK